MAKNSEQLDALENEGAGVGKVKDKVLDRLADEYTETRDAKADLAETMTKIEGKIIDRMIEKQIQVYRYADKQVTVKQGKAHVKIKTVKNEGAEPEPSDND